jgi:hypothetical protein
VRLKPLREWSFARLLLVCAGWIVLSVAAIALWIFVDIFWIPEIRSGGGGIGVVAVSFNINELVLAIPLLPPVALTVAWSIVRRRR